MGGEKKIGAGREDDKMKEIKREEKEEGRMKIKERR